MKLSTHYIYNKRMTRVIPALLFLISLNNNANGQVTKHERLNSIGRHTFNFAPSTKKSPSVKKNKDLLVVYSDRAENKAYSNHFAQRVLSEEKIGSAYYVTDEKNGFYKVVAASQSIVGKPKGFLSAFYSSKHHLKDAASAPFVGWIPKDRLLTFGHAFVSPDNNAPIKFRIGAVSASRLFSLQPYGKADSISVFKDPFFGEKTAQSVSWGQIVYAYKYDESKQAVLISDRPMLNDPTRKVLGWVPSDMVAKVGQNYTYVLNDEYINGQPLQSELLFLANGNRDDLETRVNLPLSVWDTDRSRIINIKGGDFPVSEIKRMYKGSKHLNIHLLFFEKDKAEVKALASTLQSIAIKIPQTFQTKFSMTSISDNGNRHLKCTSDYGKWLSFLEKVTSGHTGSGATTAAFQDAVNTIFNETPYVKFANDVFIILGTDEVPSFTPTAKAKLATRSACLLFVQMRNKDNTAYQNFTLQSKEALDDNISGYMGFITNYIADPKWDKPSLFKDLSTDEENVYLLDVPQNSIATGGLVFPKTNGRLSNPGFSNILDTLFVQIASKDKELITSLTDCKNKLGVQRAVPTAYVTNLCKEAALSPAELDRNSISETIYADSVLNDSALSNTINGYLFDMNELKALFDDWRDLMPYFSSTLGKKEIKTLRKLFYRQNSSINSTYRRKVLSRNSSISDLFYYKTSVPAVEGASKNARIKDLVWRKCKVNHWDTIYPQVYERLIKLEKQFKSGKLRTMKIAGTTYYFIPKQEML